MKKEYGIYTLYLTINEWEPLYERIKVDFEIIKKKHVYRLFLTEDDVLAFKLKFGDKAIIYLITPFHNK